MKDWIVRLTAFQWIVAILLAFQLGVTTIASVRIVKALDIVSASAHLASGLSPFSTCPRGATESRLVPELSEGVWTWRKPSAVKARIALD